MLDVIISGGCENGVVGRKWWEGLSRQGMVKWILGQWVKIEFVWGREVEGIRAGVVEVKN